MKFLSSTTSLKELQILNVLALNKYVTQREISSKLDISLSRVNEYLHNIIKNNYIIVGTTKNRKKYSLTVLGLKRRRYLSLDYYDEVLRIYNKSKGQITDIIYQIQNCGFKSVVLYGAGDVCKILLEMIHKENDVKVNVSYVVDDNEKKIGQTIVGHQIHSSNLLYKGPHDAILITSFLYTDSIKNKLLKENVNETNIFTMF